MPKEDRLRSDVWEKYLLKHKNNRVVNSPLLYYIFNHKLRMQALQVGKIYVRNLDNKIKNMKKDDISEEVHKKEGI